MMLRGLSIVLALSQLCGPVLAIAQDEESSAVSAADAEKGMDLRPAMVKVGQSSLGPLLTDARGHTLYALDARSVRSRYGVGFAYCRDACAQKWTALAAPTDAKPIGRWKIVKGAVGPQWAWNNNPVFTYADDKTPGSVAGNNYDDLWTVIAYVPPVPAIIAPAAVSIIYAKDIYVLTDDAGHRLFTGDCKQACSDWQPLNAGLASRPVGQWQVSHEGDRGHWLYRGQPVFVASGDLPPGAVLLQP